ncbi:sulfotransferase family protein [Laspinema olomoucense]|uniref:sulfotransferase family protein n=1 Tax=Laspinema olomoucense TaxID=3231600 RepID=UPI0021BB4F84|nr:sulfotransferase [Laspinema sp. D3a]MCT7989010.1 sulfotransferase [Laspinema sp. D3a]
MTKQLQLKLPPLGPNLVGATGGSGTRVVTRILRSRGMYLGKNLNESEDAMYFKGYFDDWIDPFISRTCFSDSSEIEGEMIHDLEARLSKHLEDFQAEEHQPWGWKNCRNMYLLPFFHRMCPQMKFLHIIRDGRDMAYSKNQNQLLQYNSLFLSAMEQEQWCSPVQSIALWSRINLWVAEYGEKNMPGQYLRIRFEDLCTAPVATIGHIFEFFGLQGNAQEIARDEVSPPDSIGRWRNEDMPTLELLHQVGVTALRKFGYGITAEFQQQDNKENKLSFYPPSNSVPELLEFPERLQNIHSQLKKSRDWLALIRTNLNSSSGG